MRQGWSAISSIAALVVLTAAPNAYADFLVTSKTLTAGSTVIFEGYTDYEEMPQCMTPVNYRGRIAATRGSHKGKGPIWVYVEWNYLPGTPLFVVGLQTTHETYNCPPLNVYEVWRFDLL